MIILDNNSLNTIIYTVGNVAEEYTLELTSTLTMDVTSITIYDISTEAERDRYNESVIELTAEIIGSPGGTPTITTAVNMTTGFYNYRILDGDDALEIGMLYVTFN